MEKTTTLNLGVNPIVKQHAEDVLSRLGISMSTAITIYLNQISMTGGMPFEIVLPKSPDSINTDLMTAEEIRKKFEEGYEYVKEGRMQNAKSAFVKFSENR